MFLTAPMEARQSKWRGEFNYYSGVRGKIHRVSVFNIQLNVQCIHKNKYKIYTDNAINC